MKLTPLAFAVAAILFMNGAAHASCAGVTSKLFGLSLGPRTGDFSELVPGVEVEVLAEVVRDVGFDTLEGRIEGWEVFRIMAFFDRGSYVGLTVIMGNGKAGEAQLEQAAKLVGLALGSELSGSSEGLVSANCDDGIDLSFKKSEWEGETAVQLDVKDPASIVKMREYISAYCSEPANIRPEDSCKR